MDAMDTDHDEPMSDTPRTPPSKPTAPISIAAPPNARGRFQPPISALQPFAPRTTHQSPPHPPASTAASVTAYPIFTPKPRPPSVFPSTPASASDTTSPSASPAPVPSPRPPTPPTAPPTTTSPSAISPSATPPPPTSPSAPSKRTPFRPSQPVQIPQPARPPSGRLAAPPVAIPHSLPNILPSFPATLFGGLSADDEHVTVWEPHTGKTVAGNAAPYRRNLQTWLDGHPGWEEKADELKSSKRRSAARRSRSAADAFSALCCYPVATFLASDAARRLAELGNGDHCDESAMMSWTNDDFVRLQEALFRLGQECHMAACNPTDIDPDRWAHATAQVGAPKLEGTVVYCAHHMLSRGIAKSQHELAGTQLPASFGALATIPADASIGSPASVGSFDISALGPSSLPGVQAGLGASFLERSFRAPREPRVTVWNPSNGRTISGNAAPCRRNLKTWMRQHPGWQPKEEGQLSSSRRNRNKKGRPSSMPGNGTASSVEPESPHFNDALEGLLFLSRSPSGVSPGNMDNGTDVQELDDRMEEEEEEGEDEEEVIVAVVGAGGEDGKKIGVTSSVSSSSAEDGPVAISDEEEGDCAKMEL